MKVVYDPVSDTLTVEFKPGQVIESDEGKPGVILDYDKDGNLVGLEILDASKHIDNVQDVQFQVAG